MVVATHLLARRRSGSKTIDDYVIKTLRGKKKLADAVAGEGLQDGLQFTESNDVMDVFNMMRAALTGKPENKEVVRKVVRSRSRKKVKAPAKKAPVEAKDPPLFIPDMDFSDI